MANLVNIWGDSDADIISDESTPTLTLKNTSTGVALLAQNTGTGPAFRAVGTMGAGATIAAFSVTASTASQAVMQVSGVFMSTASINAAGSAAAFIIPVYHESARVWGYLTASKGVI